MNAEQISIILGQQNVQKGLVDGFQEKVNFLTKQIEGVKDEGERVILQLQLDPSSRSLNEAKKVLVEADKKAGKALEFVDETTQGMTPVELANFLANCPMDTRENVLSRVTDKPNRADLLFTLTNILLDVGETGQIMGPIGGHSKDVVVSLRGF